MNKAELVNAMVTDTGLSKKDAEKALNLFVASEFRECILQFS